MNYYFTFFQAGLDEPLKTAGVDYSSCEKDYENDLSALKTIADCPDVWGRWSFWSNCSAKCGGGVKRRERIMIEGSRMVNTNFAVMFEI